MVMVASRTTSQSYGYVISVRTIPFCIPESLFSNTSATTPIPYPRFRLNPPHRLHPSPSLYLKPIHTRLAHFPLHLRSNRPF